MKKSAISLLHIGFWGCYFILVMVMLGMYFKGDEDSEARIMEALQIIFFFAVVPSIITFYSFYLFLFPKYFKQKKFLKSILVGIGLSLVAGIIGYNLLEYIVGEECFGEVDPSENIHIEMTLFMSFLASISGVVALVIKGFITWFEEMKLREALKEKNHAMEMALVKAQLDPHFLFNTINNIDVLILKNADKASEYLNQLSDMMRFMLYETKTDKILLSKEIEYIKKYIALQAIRTSNANYVNFELSGNPSNKMIAPMVFIPFIENAFKHTNNKKLDNAIKINLHVDNGSIKFGCVNKYDPNKKVKQGSNGLGNELIQKRLHLIYPEKHNLEVENQSDSYSVELTINDG